MPTIGGLRKGFFFSYHRAKDKWLRNFTCINNRYIIWWRRGTPLFLPPVALGSEQSVSDETKAKRSRINTRYLLQSSDQRMGKRKQVLVSPLRSIRNTASTHSNTKEEGRRKGTNSVEDLSQTEYRYLQMSLLYLAVALCNKYRHAYYQS